MRNLGKNKMYCPECGRLLKRGKFERTNPKYDDITGEKFKPEGSWELYCPILWHGWFKWRMPRIGIDGTIFYRDKVTDL